MIYYEGQAIKNNFVVKSRGLTCAQLRTSGGDNIPTPPDFIQMWNNTQHTTMCACWKM